MGNSPKMTEGTERVTKMDLQGKLMRMPRRPNKKFSIGKV